MAQWNILGIIRFCQGLIERETIGVYAHLQNINDEIIQLYFRGNATTPNIKEESVTSSICVCVKQYVCVCVCIFIF